MIVHKGYGVTGAYLRDRIIKYGTQVVLGPCFASIVEIIVQGHVEEGDLFCLYKMLC